MPCSEPTLLGADSLLARRWPELGKVLHWEKETGLPEIPRLQGETVRHASTQEVGCPNLQNSSETGEGVAAYGFLLELGG